MAGRPNVGKSTLLNRIVGEKLAIVSDKPQTTRTRILGIRNESDNQVLLIDIPGIHKPDSRLDQTMVRTAINTIQEADLVFLLMEMSKKGLIRDDDLFDYIKTDAPVFLVITKADRVPREALLPVIEEYAKNGRYREIIPVSAQKNENIGHLMEVAVSYLPGGTPVYPEDELTDQPVRFLAAEMIREKIIQKVYREVPYSVAVQIEQFEEKPENKQISVRAVIYVERSSQKGILIGKKGVLLKKIGTEARIDIEKLTGCAVYLELWVEVSENWKNNEQILKSLGYE